MQANFFDLAEGPVDDIPEDSIPLLLDVFTQRIHYTSLHCAAKACGAGRGLHGETWNQIRRELSEFTGKVWTHLEERENPLSPWLRAAVRDYMRAKTGAV